MNEETEIYHKRESNQKWTERRSKPFKVQMAPINLRTRTCKFPLGLHSNPACGANELDDDHPLLPHASKELSVIPIHALVVQGVMVAPVRSSLGVDLYSPPLYCSYSNLNHSKMQVDEPLLLLLGGQLRESVIMCGDGGSNRA